MLQPINRKNYETETKENFFGKYPGIISYHFGYLANYIDDWLIKKRILLSKEFWFLTLLLFFMFIDLFYKKFAGWTFFGLLTLWFINLVLPFIPFIKEKFLKSSKEKFDKILKQNDQDALDDLKEYFLINKRILEYELHKLFTSRFAENYQAYHIVFKNVKLSEKHIKWILNQKILLRKCIKPELIKLFIESCRIDISQGTFDELNKLLKQKNVPKNFYRLLIYKYIRYSNLRPPIKGLTYTIEKNYKQVITIVGLIAVLPLFGFMVLGFLISFINVDQNKTQQVIAGLSYATLVGFGIFITIWILRKLYKWFIINKIINS